MSSTSASGSRREQTLRVVLEQQVGVDVGALADLVGDVVEQGDAGQTERLDLPRLA